MDEGLPLPRDVWDRTPPEAQALILDLQARVTRLEAQVAELLAKLNKNSTNSSKPPSSDGPQVKRKPPKPKSKRSRGGQPGHPRHVRPLAPPEKVSEIVDCKPTECSHCHESLSGDDPDPIRHQVAELPVVEPDITEYRVHELTCSSCEQSTRGELPPGVPTGCFGPRLAATLVMLVGVCRLGKRKIQLLASDLWNLSISTGMICKLERKMAEILEPPVQEVAAYIREQHVNIDETSWREMGKRMWLWVVATPLISYFVIRPRRNADVAREILGEDYSFVATSDRHGAYSWLKLRQLCWSHLMRDFQAIIDRGGEGKAIGEALLQHAYAMFEWWHRVRDGTLTRGTFQKYLCLLKAAFHEDLQRGVDGDCAKTARFCRKLLAAKKFLWTFAYREGVEPTNNEGERAGRELVIYRKLSGGTASVAGSRFVERVFTAAATCHKQGRNFLDYLTECCAAHLQGRPIPSLLPPAAIATKAA